MPLHAVVVTRPNPGSSDAVRTTIAALRAQSRAPKRITVVARGQAAGLEAIEGVEAVISVAAQTRFADAVRHAAARAEGDDLWLLTDAIAPEPEALHELAAALERAPSAVIAAGKLVRPDAPDEKLLSYGQTMTTYGRAVNLVDGEFDQGQYDDQDESLGAHIVGMLVRGDQVPALLPDPALLGADEGLDMGVRARLAGGRVVLAPDARLRVRGSGKPELASLTGPQTSRIAFHSRVAQLHRRLAYAPLLAVLVHWVSFPFLALLRSVWHLIDKRPALVWPEWAAAGVAMVRPARVARSRRGIRTTRLHPRRAAWAGVNPLRATRRDERQRVIDGRGSEYGSTHEVGFFTRGGAWTVLTALVLGIAAFIPVLAWPALGGGALLPLSDNLKTLWQNASYGERALGSNLVGVADPFAGLMASLGSLSPLNTSFALNVLWVLAIPLAAAGAWFAATRISDRTGVRVFVAVAWALAPTFLTALTQGRPHAVLAHILLGWLVHSVAVAYRSWGAAGVSSLLLLGTIAAAPSLTFPLFAAWLVLVAANITSAVRHTSGPLQVPWTRRLARLAWVWVPTTVAFAPLIWWHLRRGSVWGLFVDPGKPWEGPHATTDAVGRLELAAGLPDGALGGWATVPAGMWAVVLLAPLAMCAIAAMFAPRWRFAAVMLGVFAVGTLTAWLQTTVSVNFAESTPVPIWPGTGVSLAWLGVVGAAALAIESLTSRAFVRGTTALVVLSALVAFAVPQLVSVHRGDSILTRGDASTLPAFVAASARGDDSIGTLTLTPQDDGGFAANVVWGSSETLDGQATISSTAQQVEGDDLSQIVADLLSDADSNVIDELSSRGIGFVLVAPTTDATTLAARESRLAAASALDQRAGLLRAGETDKGGLWPLQQTPGPRPELTVGQSARGHFFTITLLTVLVAALLLSLPTTSSRRLARAYGRPGAHTDTQPIAVQPDAPRGRRISQLSLRWLLAAAVPGLIVLGVVTASALPEPKITAEPPRTTVTPGATGVTFVCTDAFRVYGRDATNPTMSMSAGSFQLVQAAEDTEFILTPITSADVAAAASALRAPAGTDGPPFAAAAQSLTLADVDAAGYAASACGTPRPESWIVGGSAMLGASDVLLLSNSSSVPATADVSVIIAEPGIADVTSTRVVIAAESQRAIPLSSLVVGQQSPVVRVVASGAPVEVQLQSTQMAKLLASGIDQQTSSQPPSDELRFVGVQLLGESTEAQPLARLRVLAPDTTANVTVTLQPAGSNVPVGTPITAELTAGHAAEIALIGPPGLYEVHVVADNPVVGSVWQSSAIEPPSDFALTSPAPPLTGTVVFAVPQPPTGGAGHLHLSAGTDAPATVVLTDLGSGSSVTIDVPAGASVAQPVAAGAFQLQITGEVRAAVAMQGPMAIASWPIEAPSAERDAITVYQ